MKTNYNEKFKNDLAQGELGEKIVAHYLKSEAGYKLISYNPDKDMKYDIIMENKRGRKITIEVKTDRWENYNYRTNNIYVETSCSGKPSGIMGSKSDLYAFYFPDFEEIFLITTKDLKELYNNKSNFYNNIIFLKLGSGDGSRVKGFTIDREEHRHLFKTIKTSAMKYWS